jgi:hypothetical protein
MANNGGAQNHPIHTLVSLIILAALTGRTNQPC